MIDQILADLPANLSPSPQLVVQKGEKPESISDRMKQIEEENAAQNVQLRRWIANLSLAGVGAQLAASDVAFYMYGSSNAWHVDGPVMIGWMSATVVETIGVLLVIAKSLFPTK